MISAIKFQNTVTVEHRRAGKLLSREVKKNLVVNAGKEWLKGHMCDSGTDRAAYIGLSSGVSAPGESDTDLGATVYTDSGLERAAGAYASGATGVCTISKEFTCSAANKTVASAGLYFRSAGAGLFAGVAITAVTLQSGDKLTITWTVTVS